MSNIVIKTGISIADDSDRDTFMLRSIRSNIHPIQTSDIQTAMPKYAFM